MAFAVVTAVAPAVRPVSSCTSTTSYRSPLAEAPRRTTCSRHARSAISVSPRWLYCNRSEACAEAARPCLSPRPLSGQHTQLGRGERRADYQGTVVAGSIEPPVPDGLGASDRQLL